LTRGGCVNAAKTSIRRRTKEVLEAASQEKACLDRPTRDRVSVSRHERIAVGYRVVAELTSFHLMVRYSDVADKAIVGGAVQRITIEGEAEAEVVVVDCHIVDRTKIGLDEDGRSAPCLYAIVFDQDVFLVTLNRYSARMPIANFRQVVDVATPDNRAVAGIYAIFEPVDIQVLIGPGACYSSRASDSWHPYEFAIAHGYRALAQDPVGIT